jgi:hypothetical protein
MVWKDPETMRAIAMYIRLAVGAIFVLMLVWMAGNDRIDVETVIKAILGLLAVDKFGMAFASGRDKTG